MKYCKKCQKEIDTQDEQCPICKGKLEEVISDEDAATIVSTSTLLL